MSHVRSGSETQTTRIFHLRDSLLLSDAWFAPLGLALKPTEGIFIASGFHHIIACLGDFTRNRRAPGEMNSASTIWPQNDSRNHTQSPALQLMSMNGTFLMASFYDKISMIWLIDYGAKFIVIYGQVAQVR